MTAQSVMTKRQEWMQVLARAGETIQQFESEISQIDYQYIRQPESGMVMARGRAGGTGQAFNVGEVSVSRCVVRLAEGAMGYSYVVGRNLRHAESAAVIDALLQGNDSGYWFERIIVPLQQQQQAARSGHASEIAGSKVNFFTMVRGD